MARPKSTAKASAAIKPSGSLPASASASNMAPAGLETSGPLDKNRHALGELSPNKLLALPPLSSMGNKRTIDLISDDSDSDDSDCDSDASSGPDVRGMYIDKNCDQIRRLIRNFIDCGEMKVGVFQRSIGVSAPAYGRFMAQNGRDKGSQSDTYVMAWKFFKKRELQGIKQPTKKRAKTSGSSAAATQSTVAKKPGSETAKGKDLSNIQLEGEEDDKVPVFDTCDEIRRKINAHLRQDGIVVAAFLRDLQAQYRTAKAPPKIQSAQLAAFRNKKGPDSGNTSCVFYASYCFFERLRIAEGKKMSAHRLDMEDIYPDGMNTTRVMTNVAYVCMRGRSIVKDKYGRVSSV